jgi:hypothetical protein
MGHAPPAFGRDALSQIGIRQKEFNGVSEGLRTVRRHEHAIQALTNLVWRTTHASGDCRDPRGHRFQDHERRSLAAGRHDEHVEGWNETACIRPAAEKLQVTVQPQSASPPFQAISQRSVADDNGPNVGMFRKDTRHLVQE